MASSTTLVGLANQLRTQAFAQGAASGGAINQPYAAEYNPRYVTPEGDIVRKDATVDPKWGGNALSSIFAPLLSPAPSSQTVQQAGFPIWGAVAIGVGALLLITLLRKKG